MNVFFFWYILCLLLLLCHLFIRHIKCQEPKKEKRGKGRTQFSIPYVGWKNLVPKRNARESKLRLKKMEQPVVVGFSFHHQSPRPAVNGWYWVIITATDHHTHIQKIFFFLHENYVCLFIYLFFNESEIFVAK